MHVHGPSHVHGPHSVNAPHRRETAPIQSAPKNIHQTDQLEISREANYVSQAHEIPDIRSERVDQIRAQIEAGTYETSEKLELALSNLLNEIG